MQVENITISGVEAMQRAQRAKMMGQPFGLLFITCDLNRETGGQFRRYDSVQMRAAKRGDVPAKVSPDHYLFFTDETTGEPRTCFKKLVRQICFGDVWFNVNWFE